MKPIHELSPGINFMTTGGHNGGGGGKTSRPGQLAPTL